MRSTIILQLVLAVLLSCSAYAAGGTDELKTSYLYNLSDFTGAKPYSAAKIAFDEEKNEVYALSGESVSIFNASGMEIFRLDYDPSLGVVHDVAVHPEGDMFLLVLKDRRMGIVRCNFRGETLSHIEMTEMPPELSSFVPERLFLRDGRLYLAGLGSMQVVITDTTGRFLESHDLAAKIGLTDSERNDSGIGGISLDRDGTILFTIPATAKVYRLSKDGQLKSFGKRGSGPGKFGVISGVAADKDGNLLVTDTLRCLVAVFDKDFKFIREFGFRGFGPGNLIGPNEIVVDSSNKAYVSQIRKRGVSVYQIGNS